MISIEYLINMVQMHTAISSMEIFERVWQASDVKYSHLCIAVDSQMHQTCSDACLYQRPLGINLQNISTLKWVEKYCLIVKGRQMLTCFKQKAKKSKRVPIFARSTVLYCVLRRASIHGSFFPNPKRLDRADCTFTTCTKFIDS